MIAIACVSAALLVDEILLSSIFHVLMGGGNTIAAISIALLGLSSAGVVSCLVPAFGAGEHGPLGWRALAFAFGVALIVCTTAIVNTPLNYMDLAFATASGARVQALRLLVYGLAVLPFFVGGLAVIALMRLYAAAISRIYFADLVGAALGCFASPWLLTALGAPRAIVVLAAPVLWLGSASRRGRRWWWLAPPLAALALLLARPDLLQFRKLNSMGQVDAPAFSSFLIGPSDIEYERWALDAWTIIRADSIPQQ
jgi:hypothetical protein